MPRRLGDDPLARAKKGTTGAATAAAPSAAARAASLSRVSSQESYNDVFFQRRVETGNPVTPDKPRPEAAETREISEVSEIPELREAGVARVNVGGATMSAAPPVAAVAAPSAAQSLIEPETLVSAPGRAAAPQAVNKTEVQPEPEKNDGFLKRFFNRFGK